MENFTNSIKDSSSYMYNSSPNSLTYGESNVNDLGDSIKNTSPTTWIIIILILTFLGVNIFAYLAKGTQGVSDFFAPIITQISSIFGGVTGQVVGVSAEGSKAVVSTAAQGTQSAVGATADVVNAGLSTVQEVAQPSQQTQSSLKSQNVNDQQVDIMQANTLNRALNSATSQKQQLNGEDYQADDSLSSIQMSSTTGKAGWCYIGEERGFRTCSEVGVNDTCMS